LKKNWHIKSFGYRKSGVYLLVPLVGVLLALFFTAMEPMAFGQRFKYILHTLVMTSGIWTGCTLIVRYLWLKFPWEQMPGKHLVLEILLILGFTNLFSWGIYTFEQHMELFPPEEDLYLSILITNLITIIITGIHEAVEFYRQWKYNFSKSVRLEKDNIEARYEMLRNQINPHFLFNSLNSLVALVEDNKQAVSYIENLSGFLRYMLKSRDRQVVLLREEQQVLEQYVALQQTRFGSNLKVDIRLGEMHWHYATPPMVLQMLVENCIKHNVLSKEKPLYIQIWADGERLYVANTLQPRQSDCSTGHGLQNISERYRFFTTEQVCIHQSESEFKVSVPLLKVDL